MPFVTSSTEFNLRQRPRRFSVQSPMLQAGHLHRRKASTWVQASSVLVPSTVHEPKRSCSYLLMQR